jgi:uncharacterized membrane protein YjjP (DUF1212 family)
MERARLSPEVLADYLVEVAAALVRYGCPSYRLEEVVARTAELEGYQVESFALPTGVFLNVLTPDGRPVHRMARVKDWTLDLGRLGQIDAIFNDVSARRIDLAEGLARLRALEDTPRRRPGLDWVAQAAVAAAAAALFHGGPSEIALGGLSGLGIGALWRAGRRWPRVRLLGDLAGGALAAGVASLGARLLPSLSREVVVLAGVILLVPGMTFTTGLAELVYKNLVSGGARLMEALITFLSLVFGVALVLGLERFVGGQTVSRPPPGSPLALQVGAVVVAGLGFARLFRVPARLVLPAIGSALLAWGTARLAGAWVPLHLAAFASSLVLSLYANALARWTARPAQIFQLPGMMLLVPGSFGFLSLNELVSGALFAGAERAVAMVLVASALVMGILFGNVILRPLKIL